MTKFIDRWTDGHMMKFKIPIMHDAILFSVNIIEEKISMKSLCAEMDIDISIESRKTTQVVSPGRLNQVTFLFTIPRYVINEIIQLVSDNQRKTL